MLSSPKPTTALHQALARGDLPAVRALLRSHAQHKAISARKLVNTAEGWNGSPLMRAAASPHCGVDMLALLLEHGADVSREVDFMGVSSSALAAALGAGNLAKVKYLVQAGADLHYTRDGYNAAIDAVHGRDILHDGGLLPLLAWLVEQKVNLNAITRYAESALRVLSRIGRFDAVKLLLDAGADASQLAFSPLHAMVAFGGVQALAAALPQSKDLEAADFWSRTPLLLAAQVGDIPKIQALLEHGANFHAVGRCAKPLLFCPIEMGRADVLCWLVERGADVEQADEFGITPLMAAAQADHVPSIDVLLAAGATVDHQKGGETALSVAAGRASAQRLLAAGAAPSFLTREGKRLLLGLSGEADPSALDCTCKDFESARVRRFAARNGQDITTPYYVAMIRSGVTAYAALQALVPDPKAYDRFGDTRIPPIWCADRFGQSLTFLPDGRIVQIAGEHEDHYDPDFCIYNDVFVHERDGNIKVYGYPECDFPPTDFHSATLIGKFIYIIGNLGYPGIRTVDTTPVFRLDTDSMTITRLDITGHAPSWLHRHNAVLLSPDEIEVSGGTVIEKQGEEFAYHTNADSFVLNIDTRVWRKS